MCEVGTEPGVLVTRPPFLVVQGLELDVISAAEPEGMCTAPAAVAGRLLFVQSNLPHVADPHKSLEM